MFTVNKTNTDGCFELIPRIFTDQRGVSIKPFHKDAFEELGFESSFNEDLIVTSGKYVVRGLHFQYPPFQQIKLVFCISGSMFDVAVDIRRNSPTYGNHTSLVIDAAKHNMIYIPAGFAHGYQALEDNTTVAYKISTIYSPNNEGGIRWDSMNISWPFEKALLSEKDKNWPGFKSFKSEF